MLGFGRIKVFLKFGEVCGYGGLARLGKEFGEFDLVRMASDTAQDFFLFGER